MTAIDCAPVNCLSLQAGGRTGCQCSAATQLEPGLERYSALVVLGVLGGAGNRPPRFCGLLAGVFRRATG